MVNFLNGQLEHHLSESDVEMDEQSGSERSDTSHREEDPEAQEEVEEESEDQGEEGMAVGLVPRAGLTSPKVA